MSKTTVQLESGGLLPAKTKVDRDVTEQLVARTYRHPAMGTRPVIRLTSERLGQAEDLAMEFLGFESPEVSKPIAVQQRRSLGFAAWALTNDPDNARYALDLVKRMKAAARKAKSKPGHAWDAYTELSKELGRSARHFLPPYWEEVGRTFMDLGNQTYAGRALSKSLEAERVHALESDRARRRDVVLEFVLAGCLAGKALSDYSNDLSAQYSADEAFSIFRDLCSRRTRGGMAPWAAMPRDFIKMAKAAGLDGDQELEKWLEEIIETPAMGRTANQFWKTCSKLCKRIVARNPAFAVALLRHTKPADRYYGESKLWPWLDLLEAWGVFEFLWEDEHRGAPPLGEPVAVWFGRIIREETPVTTRVLEMLDKLTPRLKKEKTPLPLWTSNRYRSGNIDIDVLEACLVSGILVDDPPENVSVTFSGWLAAEVDHPYRNQDLVESWKDDRFKTAIFTAMNQALTCRGGTLNRGWRQTDQQQQAFPLAAGDRPGIKELWHEHTSQVLARLEGGGLPSFTSAGERLESTLWPETLRLFDDLTERLSAIDPPDMLLRTLQAGVFDEYGLLAFEEVVDASKVDGDDVGSDLFPCFPNIIVKQKAYAHVIGSDGKVEKYELRVPSKCDLSGIAAIGDDLAVCYRDKDWEWHFFWASNPSQKYLAGPNFPDDAHQMATVLADGSVFLGKQAIRPGDKQLANSETYFHDGKRFWQVTVHYDVTQRKHQWKIQEIDPQTGKTIRQSVPPWFEKTDDGELLHGLSELIPAPAGAENSPLGIKDGMLGWKTVKRRDGSFFGEGIDGRRWDKPLRDGPESTAIPISMLRQPGTNEYLPVTCSNSDWFNDLKRPGVYQIWDPTGSTIVAVLNDFSRKYAAGQVTTLPIHFWHLMKPRHEPSSKKLRSISQKQCVTLLKAAADDREELKQKQKQKGKRVKKNKDGRPQDSMTKLLPAVKKFLPKAPERMALGIASVIEKAEREGTFFTTLREKAIAESQNTKGTAGSSRVVHQKIDAAAAHWNMETIYIYDEDEDSLGAHLTEAAAFLKGESEGGDLPRTTYVWFSMLKELLPRLWQTFWRTTATKMGQKDGSDVPWLDFIEFWHELGIAGLPGQFATMDAAPEGWKKPHYGSDLVALGTSFTIQNGDDLFVAIANDNYGSWPYHILRYSTAETPGNPPGYKVQKIRKLKTDYDPEQTGAFIQTVRSSDGLPLPTKEELEEVATNLAASPAEIGLIWLGGLNMDTYENNFLPSDLRKALGWKVADAGAARQSLNNLKESVRTHLYASVIAPGVCVPFAADRGPVLRSIEKVWRAKMPKRLPLDATLQKRLSALGKTSRWNTVDHEQLLAAAAEPTKHPLLQPREMEIRLKKQRHYATLSLDAKKKNEPSIESDSLRSIAQLAAMVHGETLAGHGVRAEVPALIKQTMKLLDSPKILLGLQHFYLCADDGKKSLKPTEWINKHLGKTKAREKDGTVRFDDGLISAMAADSNHQVLVAFRPAKLKDQSDLTRLHGILGINIRAEDGGENNGCVSLVALAKSPGFQKLTKAVLAKNVPDGQWPQNPSHTATAVVEGIQKKFGLGEDAAVLYAQLLALPEPTTSNLRAWNGWTAARLKKAAAELVKKKRVLEAKRPRAGRTIFLPGEWADLKAPWLPIETWKLPHLVELDIDADKPCPAGGPMVLRPFEDLFAAAWQRVLDGDEPRYEEVSPKRTAARKRKTK